MAGGGTVIFLLCWLSFPANIALHTLHFFLLFVAEEVVCVGVCVCEAVCVSFSSSFLVYFLLPFALPFLGLLSLLSTLLSSPKSGKHMLSPRQTLTPSDAFKTEAFKTEHKSSVSEEGGPCWCSGVALWSRTSHLGLRPVPGWGRDCERTHACVRASTNNYVPGNLG